MTTLSVTDRKRGAMIGAAVADAASLGFHWLYDQDRIRTLAPTNPEFRSPSAADYENVPGYFAHGRKRSGDLSQYGEQHLTLLRALSHSQGVYNKLDYESAFVNCFGYGGTYTGYIDHPTRDTLNNIILAENKALADANALAFTGSDELKRKLITKVLGNAKQYSGEQLKEKVEASVRLTDNDEYLVSHALKMVDLWESVQGLHGADDTQLPALSKLTALVACYADNSELTNVVESAIRVTNNNDAAVEYGQCVAKSLEAVILTGDIESALAVAQQYPSELTKSAMEKVLHAQTLSTPEATAQWGMACQLNIGFPSAMHNISLAKSYSTAVQQNIYAGGDSCGRAIVVGAMLGACYGIGGDTGIPKSWIGKLNCEGELGVAVNRLLDATQH